MKTKTIATLTLALGLFLAANPAWAKRPTYRNWTATENIRASGNVVSSPSSAAAVTDTAIPNATVTNPCDGSTAIPNSTETPLLAISSVDADTGDKQNWIEVAVGSVSITPSAVNTVGCPFVHVFAYTGFPTGCTDFASCAPLMTKRSLLNLPICAGSVQTVNFLLPQVNIPPTDTAQTFISVVVDPDTASATDQQTCAGANFFTLEHNSLGVTLLP